MTFTVPALYANVLVEVCDLITQGRLADAENVLISDYPQPLPPTTRVSRTPTQVVRMFLRDGFTDRYSGARLVYPGALVALSILLTTSFPYQQNWKRSETHPAIWDLYPTLDHVFPLARGGPDVDSNLVTTSMIRNDAKGNWLLEELGWPTERAPLVPGWDGLLPWFMNACTVHAVLRDNKSIQDWRRAATKAQAAEPLGA